MALGSANDFPSTSFSLSVPPEPLAVNEAVRSLSRFRKKLGTEMCEIVPDLYLGSLRDATDLSQLKKYKIKHLVSVHELTMHHSIHAELRIDVFRVPLADCASANIARHFAAVNSYIHTQRLRQEPVLVHCLAGVSRSASMIVAYLCTIADITYFNALAHVISRRAIVNPNFGFRMQLCKYIEEDLLIERARLRVEFGPSKFDAQWEQDHTSLAHRADMSSNKFSSTTACSRERRTPRRHTTQVLRNDVSSHALSSPFLISNPRHSDFPLSREGQPHHSRKSLEEILSNINTLSFIDD